jgi:hypothetical protein
MVPWYAAPSWSSFRVVYRTAARVSFCFVLGWGSERPPRISTIALMLTPVCLTS